MIGIAPAPALLALFTLLAAAACSPEDLVIEGDVSVATKADLDKLRDCTRIVGSLTVKRADIAELVLPRLVEVGGRLALQKNRKLVAVELPALVTVGRAPGHELIVERNYALETLDLGGLVTAADGVIVSNNPRLARLDLAKLEQVGRYGVEVISNDGVKALALPGLTTTPRLHVESCYRLERLGIGALVHAGNLRIRANPSLTRIETGENPAGTAPVSRDGVRRHAPGKDAAFEVRNNFALPTCEAVRLHDRLHERDWRGPVAICSNRRDTCEPVGCETADAGPPSR